MSGVVLSLLNAICRKIGQGVTSTLTQLDAWSDTETKRPTFKTSDDD